MSVEAYPTFWVFLVIIAMGVIFVICTLAITEETESFEKGLRVISEASKE